MMSTMIDSLEPRRLLSGSGLVGYYFNDITESTPVMSRNDSQINFNFGSSPPVPQMGSQYSIEWQGQILPPTTGVYTFYVDATDGVQLTVRGTTIINRRSDGSGELSGTIPLSGGNLVDLTLDYYNDTNNGSVQLYWSYPGQTKQLLPNSALYNTFGNVNTFTDPIAPNGADPWVTYENGEYYYALSDGGALYVAASSTLQGIGTAPEIKIFSPPAGSAYSSDLWAPELHFINGKWYVYFAADAYPGDNDAHRMYVLESSTTNPQGSYAFEGEIAPLADTGVPTTTSVSAIDHWAIDGTVINIGSNMYFVWSGWDGTDPNGNSGQVQQNLYIALMSSPTKISGYRYLLSEPTYSWEQVGLPINEGPEELTGPTGKVFVIYSASGYWTNNYCLGQLTYTGSMTNASAPLSATNWSKNPSPVFQQNGNAVGVGHASFTVSPDGTQDWIVYHAHNTTGNFTGTRDIRIQQFTFNADGTPNFGSPVAPNTPLPEPSGTPHYEAAFNYPVYPSASSAIIASSTTTSNTKTAANKPTIVVPIKLTPVLPTLPPIAPTPAVPKSISQIMSVLEILPASSDVMSELALLSVAMTNTFTTNVKTPALKI